MQLKFFPVYLTVLVYNLTCTNLTGQSWNFIKERDGIKIYTRSEENTTLKSFMGEADLYTNMEEISSVIGSIESFDWWEEDISEIKVLDYKKDKFIRYYLIYDVQWPFSDRDLCVEALITEDSITGRRVVSATPLIGFVPEKPGLVRIKNYWQQWTMEPAGNGIIHLTLEGSVDPGGSIPNWLINLVISETPLNIMRKVREQVED